MKSNFSNNVLKTEFVHCYFNCDPFKQKDIAHINMLINTTRLHDYMGFNCYANISFDESDRGNRFPIISMVDENGEQYQWSRKTTNCLVYDMKRHDKNDRYDKLFLYQTCASNGSGIWYGWIAWDSKTNRTSHRFFVIHEYQDLMQALNRMIYNIPELNKHEKLFEQAKNIKLLKNSNTINNEQL